jgi:hypothetical protein
MKSGRTEELGMTNKIHLQIFKTYEEEIVVNYSYIRRFLITNAEFWISKLLFNS